MQAPQGAAWETAMRVTPLMVLFGTLDDGVTAKFSSVRQKLFSASPLGSHLALTVTAPSMCTSSGFCPRPATWV